MGIATYPRACGTGRRLFFVMLLAVGMLLTVLSSLAQDRRVAMVLDVEGVIGPATADYVLRGLDRAQRETAELVVLRMDTPGGLDSSMRDIVKGILGSSVPVVGYVGPAGARAASAGTYILYGSHVAAMAPSTHLGAATPVQLGGGMPGAPDSPAERYSPAQPTDDGDDDTQTEAQQPGGEPTTERREPRRGETAMERKTLEDAVAYIRGLAERHGRNADWAEDAVREAVSLTASEALKMNVIDLMADNLTDLLNQLDGQTVTLVFGEKTLNTAGIEVIAIEPDWRTRLLSVITNPNIAYILMLIGIYGIIFELANPGTVFSGVIGAICLVLALYAFQVLPINYAGLALILLGLVFIVAEAFVPSFGILGFGGVIAFVIGSVILVDDDSLQVSLPLIGGTALFTAAFFAWGMGRFIQLRKTKVITGQEELIGAKGVAMRDFTGKGPIWLHSERWTAVCDQPLAKDQEVRVVAIDGLTVKVEPIEAAAADRTD